MAHHLTTKKCPHCGDVDSLVVDYQLGEVACSSCAMVVQGGLEEDESTRWEEDGVGVDSHTARRDMARIDRVGAKSGGAGRGIDRLRSLLEAIQGRVNVTDNVVDAAQAYAERYTAHILATNGARMDPPLLAATCFMLAGQLRHYPVQPHELEALPVLKDVTASKIDAAKSKLLLALTDLKKEIAEHSATAFWPDLVSWYGRRLRPQTLSVAQVSIASTMASKFHDVVTSRLSPSNVALLVIFLTVAHPRAVELANRVNGKPPVVASGATKPREADKVWLAAVAAAGRCDALEFERRVVPAVTAEDAAKLINHAAAALQPPAGAAAATSDAASAQLTLPEHRKRERD